MNMNEPLSKDVRGEEGENNFSSDGKPGSYDSNSNSAQRKKSFSTTKPTEYNLPKEQPESTAKNLETKAKNILLPWRKKHNKCSENSATDTDVSPNSGPNTNVTTSDMSSAPTGPEFGAGPHVTTTHKYSHVKTTTPASTHEHPKVKTTSPNIHEQTKVGTGPSGATAMHTHSNIKTTPPTSHEHSKVSSGPIGTTAMHGHSKLKTATSPASHEQSKARAGAAGATSTHGHASVKTTHSAAQGHANVNTGRNATATTHGDTDVKHSASVPQERSSTDHDTIPGSFRDTTGTGLSAVDPSVYTETSPRTYPSTATGPPQDTMREIAQKVKMDESQQTGLKNDQISGSDVTRGQTMDPKYRDTMGAKSDLPSQQPPSYDDNMKNVQYPEKTMAEKQTISENAAEKFRSERDDILGSGDDYQDKNAKSKVASGWSPIEYSTTADKNKNLQDVVVPRDMSDRSHDDTTVPPPKSDFSDTKWRPLESDNGSGTKNNSQHVVGSQGASTNIFSRNEGQSSGAAKNTAQNIVVPPPMKDEDLSKDYPKTTATKSNEYGLDYLDDVEDYNEHDINDYPNANDEGLAQHQEKPMKYSHYERKEQIPGAFNVDTFSNAMKRKGEEGPLSSKQTTHPAEMEAEGGANLGKYEFSNLSSNNKPTDLNKNNSGPAPTRSNLIDQIEPRRTKTTENITSNAGNTNAAELGSSRNVDTAKTGGIWAKTFNSTPFDNTKTVGAHPENSDVTAFDNTGTTDTAYAKSRNADTAAYDNTRNADTGYIQSENVGTADFGSTTIDKSENVVGTQERPSEEQTASAHDSSGREHFSDHDIDVNKNTKVLDEDALGRKHEMESRNKHRTDIGDTDTANFPSLIDPHVPTYGFKDAATSQNQALPSQSEPTPPQTTDYSIHNETTSQGRKVSVGSMGSGHSKDHHSHHHNKQDSSKGSDYDYDSNYSAEHTPRHHPHEHAEGEHEYEGEEQGEEHTGKQSFMGRVRNSISGGTFGFRSEI